VVGISSQNNSGFLRVLFEGVVLAILMLAVPLILALDIIVLEHGVQEISVTEFTQEGLLFLSMVLIGITAWQRPDSRGFLVLVTGLFAAMLIREVDVFLDTISQGFWIYPAVLISAGAIIYSTRLRGTVFTPMIRFSASKPFAYLVIGLLLVLLFSRAFGTSQFWSEIMGADYNRLYKSIIQEGLELLGYALICFGSVLIYQGQQTQNTAA